MGADDEHVLFPEIANELSILTYTDAILAADFSSPARATREALKYIFRTMRELEELATRSIESEEPDNANHQAQSPTPQDATYALEALKLAGKISENSKAMTELILAAVGLQVTSEAVHNGNDRPISQNKAAEVSGVSKNSVRKIWGSGRNSRVDFRV